MKVFKTFLFLSSLALTISRDLQDNYLPIFNLKSGFYNSDSIEVRISIKDPKALIYYTLDGSVPTVKSTIYKYPIILKNRSFLENVYSKIIKVSPDRNYVPIEKIKKANIIRAMAKLSNGTFTPAISKTYFVVLREKHFMVMSQ